MNFHSFFIFLKKFEIKKEIEGGHTMIIYEGKFFPLRKLHERSKK